MRWKADVESAFQHHFTVRWCCTRGTSRPPTGPSGVRRHRGLRMSRLSSGRSAYSAPGTAAADASSPTRLRLGLAASSVPVTSVRGAASGTARRRTVGEVGTPTVLTPSITLTRSHRAAGWTEEVVFGRRTLPRLRRRRPTVQPVTAATAAPATAGHGGPRAPLPGGPRNGPIFAAVGQAPVIREERHRRRTSVRGTATSTQDVRRPGMRAGRRRAHRGTGAASSSRHGLVRGRYWTGVHARSPPGASHRTSTKRPDLRDFAGTRQRGRSRLLEGSATAAPAAAAARWKYRYNSTSAATSNSAPCPADLLPTAATTPGGTRTAIRPAGVRTC